MKKLILSAAALATLGLASAQTEAGTHAIDDFDSSTELANADGEGIFWYVGEGGEDFYSIERTDTGMVVELTDACYDPLTITQDSDGLDVDAGDYFGFGFSFGDSNGEEEGGDPNWVNLGANANITLELSNYSDADIFMTVQLQDTEGNKGDIVPEDSADISWGNKWEKINATIAANATETIEIDLSSIAEYVGGYEALKWDCGSAVDLVIILRESKEIIAGVQIKPESYFAMNRQYVKTAVKQAQKRVNFPVHDLIYDSDGYFTNFLSLVSNFA